MALNIETLKRYFSGNYSRKDYLLIRERLHKSEPDRELKELMEAHWEEFSTEALREENIDSILHKLHHRIHLEENRESRNLSWWKVFQKVAAIIILPLILSFFAYLFWQAGDRSADRGFAEIQCPMGVRIKFQLPDGTTGFLNSGSTLRYPLKFKKLRQVNLVGEAFFDVVPKKKSTFLVQTKTLNINVLGTTFNVIAYADEKIEEVILQSGSLHVMNKDGKMLAELTPNQKLDVNTETGTVIKSSVIASQYTGWKDGKLVFRNENMEHVARRLSRWYNAEIIVDDKTLYQYTFYATFQDEDLDEVLKLLKLTTPIMYEELKRELSSDGIYPKRKIILKRTDKKKCQFK